MRTRTIGLAAVAVLGAAGTGAAILLPRPATETPVTSAAELQAASFTVENMTCATCPITVRRAMQGVAGVHDVTIDYEAQTATAQFDPSQTTTNAIAAASAQAGYPAQLAEG